MKKLFAFLLACAMLLSCVAMAEEVPFELSVDWDAEYDVVVVGMGAAGSAAAITAAQQGANVLVVDKAPEGHVGGNSAVCMQWACMADDKEMAMTYMKAMRGGFDTPTDEMIETYVDNISQNAQWLADIGAPNVTEFRGWVEFPDLEGAGGIYLVTVDGNTGIGAGGLKPSLQLYKLLKRKVESFDNITVWYEAPAEHLVQDKATNIIHGVEVNVGGKTVLVRAKNGVVLACGGYESNFRMLQDYNDILNCVSCGNAFYNTGDGIRMAQEVGARLWHMANVVWPGSGFRFDCGTSTFGSSAGAGMTVGGDGTIYKSVGKSSHGKMYFYGNYVQALYPDVTWAVFDTNTVHLKTIHNSFSEGNEWEIEHGYFLKADTLEELAAMTNMPVEALLASVETFNATSETPIVEAPFYALRMHSSIVNTQGGPERSVKGEVIDLYGNPIPHLYEAGELGDVWSHCYQASCNIGGGLAFGRISGTNAAAAKEDNYQGSVMEGKTAFAPTVEEKVWECADNQFIGRGEGKSTVPITVRVTKDGDDITDVELLECWETEGLTDRTKEVVINQIIEKDTAVVDVVSGCTWTSVGIMSAVADALK